MRYKNSLSCTLFALAAAVAAIPALAGASSPSAAGAAPAAEALNKVEQALQAAQVGDLRAIDELLAAAALDARDRLLLEAQRNAALLREREADQSLSRYFASQDHDPARLARAHAIAAETAFFAGRYRTAASHAAQSLKMPGQEQGGEAAGMTRLAQIAKLLADIGPRRLEGRGQGVPAPTTRDKVGLIRTRVLIGSAGEDAVIDTGANLSVVSSSAAKRLGLRLVEGNASVANSVGGGVNVRLAVADRLEVAGATLGNVIFLVIADEALTFPVPGGYNINLILGMPELRALGRLQFGPGDTLRIGGGAPLPQDSPNLRLIGSSPYLLTSVAGRELPLFFDTGANRSTLSKRFADEHPELQLARGREGRKAGAGGVQMVSTGQLERVTIAVGGRAAEIAALDIELKAAPGENQAFGVIGADLFRHFQQVTIDFEHMKVDVR